MQRFYGSPQNHQTPLLINVLFLGDEGSGKTSLIYRFLYKRLPSEVESQQKHVHVYRSQPCHFSDQTVVFQCWEMDASVDVAALPPDGLDFDAALILYPKANKTSAHDYQHWHAFVDKVAKKPVVKFLVGTKIDECPRLSHQFGLQHVQDAGKIALEPCLGYIEVSAKTAKDVLTLFNIVAEQVIVRQHKEADEVVEISTCCVL